MQRFPHAPRRQSGVATVLVTLVLLLAVALISLYTSRSAVVEQRISANEVRTKQALAAANAGTEHALAYIRNGGMDQNSDGVVDSIGSNDLASSGGTSARYKVVFHASGVAPIPECQTTYSAGITTPTAPTNLKEILAVSCGWSDDDTSVQRVAQRLTATPSLAGTVTTPLVTKGTASLLTGGASILNYFNDLTVWSGGSLLGQSNTGKTFIRKQSQTATNFRDVGTSPACNNPPQGYECSTQGATLGHDTVGGDTNLSSLSSDEFFSYFLGEDMTPAKYRDTTATWVIDANGTLTGENSTDIASVVGKTEQVIWVEGNVALPNTGTVGAPDKPVVMVINGNMDVGAGLVVYGLVFVNGNITGTGGPTFYGSLISAGAATANGNLKIVYDPVALLKAGALGKAAKLTGTWRDW